MLLSSDWFSACWADVSLVVDHDAAVRLKELCRKEVKLLLGRSRRYENASFEVARVDRTRGQFIQALALIAPTSPFTRACVSILKAGRKYPPQPFAAFQISHLNHRLTRLAYDEIGDSLGPVLKGKLLGLLGATLQPQRDYEALAQGSSTSWDRFLRSLTPDQPTLLSDILTAWVIPQLEVDRLRQATPQLFSPAEVETLQQWYETEARDLGMPLRTTWWTQDESSD